MKDLKLKKKNQILRKVYAYSENRRKYTFLIVLLFGCFIMSNFNFSSLFSNFAEWFIEQYSIIIMISFYNQEKILKNNIWRKIYCKDII